MAAIAILWHSTAIDTEYTRVYEKRISYFHTPLEYTCTTRVPEPVHVYSGICLFLLFFGCMQVYHACNIAIWTYAIPVPVQYLLECTRVRTRVLVYHSSTTRHYQQRPCGLNSKEWDDHEARNAIEGAWCMGSTVPPTQYRQDPTACAGCLSAPIPVSALPTNSSHVNICARC